MSKSKAMIVKRCCELANCGIPDPGELAFDLVYEAYMEGVDYERNNETYPRDELVESLVPYNNYNVATVFTQLQLYNERPDYFNGFIPTFQSMIFDVLKICVDDGRGIV
jgi:hypothetical protein|tara:strand:- start:1619 stop:1945 length:327 start_codon:yes stop_codon:yes gene_type:complete